MISTGNSKNMNSMSNTFLELSQECDLSCDVRSFTHLLHLNQPRRSSGAKRGAAPIVKQHGFNL